MPSAFRNCTRKWSPPLGTDSKENKSRIFTKNCSDFFRLQCIAAYDMMHAHSCRWGALFTHFVVILCLSSALLKADPIVFQPFHPTLFTPERQTIHFAETMDGELFAISTASDDPKLWRASVDQNGDLGAFTEITVTLPSAQLGRPKRLNAITAYNGGVDVAFATSVGIYRFDSEALELETPALWFWPWDPSVELRVVEQGHLAWRVTNFGSQSGYHRMDPNDTSDHERCFWNNVSLGENTVIKSDPQGIFLWRDIRGFMPLTLEA